MISTCSTVPVDKIKAADILENNFAKAENMTLQEQIRGVRCVLMNPLTPLADPP